MSEIRGRRFRRAAAADFAPRHDVADFSISKPGTYLVLPSGRMSLADVQAGECRGAGDEGARYARLDRSEVSIQRPLGMPDQGPGFLSEVRYPDLEISLLQDCICLPGGVILKDDTVLLESFSASWEAYQHRHLKPDGDRWIVSRNDEVTHEISAIIEEPVLFLDHQHLLWFGHYMLDLMTRAWAHEFCEAFLRIPLVKVACSSPAPPYASTYFQAAGVAPENVIFFDKPIFCKSLFVATKAMQIQEYTTPVALRLWQGIFNRVVAQERSTPARIYISRRANPTRRLVEEDLVERLFVARGFVPVYPEAIDIVDQINLFGKADLIAGCSGSNMFNLAFARRARSAFILVSSLLVHYQEQLLATGLSLSLRYLVGYPDAAELAERPGYVHCHWHIDIDLLAELVDEWLSGCRRA